MNYVIACFGGAYPPEQDAYRKKMPGRASFSVPAVAFSMTGRDSSGSSAICSGDLPFLSVVGAALTYHRYNFPALSNRILSMISFALLTERYPSSIFSLRTLHGIKPGIASADRDVPDR